jgi:enoyl-CoA hydratase/carnithine racemase
MANNTVPTSDLVTLWPDLTTALQGPDLPSIVNAITALKGHSQWLDKAINNMHKGSPTALHLTYRQQQQTLSQWRDAFVQEYYIGVNALQHGEFQEGIRALLIDKDNRPHWRYPSLTQVPEAWLDEFYQQQGINPPDYA